MRKLTDNAARARRVLERANAPLSDGCEQIVAREIERTLAAYFELCGDIKLKIVRTDKIYITVEAAAESVKPFGIIEN